MNAIPEDVVALVRRASQAVPAQAWDQHEVRRAVARRGRRRLAAIVAGGLVAVTGGAAAVVAVGGPSRPAGDTQVLWAQAVDANHLYALRADCPDPGCRVRLLGSDDGGATWTERTDRVSTPAAFGPTVVYAWHRHPGPVELTAWSKPEAIGVDHQGAPPAVSTDGGRTWVAVRPTIRPWTTVPDRAVFGCHRAESWSPCTVVAVDPASARMSPVAVPAGFRVTDTRQAGGRLWLTGIVEELGRSVMAGAVSRDDGLTWTVHNRPCDECTTDAVVLPTGDGRTAYWVPTWLDAGDDLTVHRSTDEGTTWHPLDGAGSATASSPVQVHAIVAADGALIIVLVDGRHTVTSTWEIEPGGTGPRPVDLPGLPATLRPAQMKTTPLSGAPPAGYVAVPADGGRFYRSSDGRHWTPVDVA